jgi:hypothetical protein
MTSPTEFLDQRHQSVHYLERTQSSAKVFTAANHPYFMNHL